MKFKLGQIFTFRFSGEHIDRECVLIAPATNRILWCPSLNIQVGASVILKANFDLKNIMPKKERLSLEKHLLESGQVR